MKNFQNKVAVVTGGGGSGIGNALVNLLAKQGAKVAFCDIANLEKTQAELTALGATFYSEKVDMADKEAIRQFVNNVLAEFSCVDILINNAGIPLGDLAFEDVTEEDFERITNINYWGVIYTTQFLYKHMLTRPESALVNVSSAQGIMTLPYLVPYCTTKFAVRGLTDTLRTEHKIRGIDNMSVHTVHPGAVATNISLTADHLGVRSDAFHRDLQKGASPTKAAAVILNGVRKKKGRIFISDGIFHDIAARLFPTFHYVIVRWLMKIRKIEIT